MWDNEQQEKKGIIDQSDLKLINSAKDAGIIPIALGKWVHKKLASQGLQIQYLPHPASRRKKDREALENGLHCFSSEQRGEKK